MVSETRTTTDHGEIRSWVEAQNGRPASVRGTPYDDDAAGVLRIDFPGGAGEADLEHISWDDWFATFEDRGLAFLYQAERSGGGGSTFFKLIDRERAADRGGRRTETES